MGKKAILGVTLILAVCVLSLPAFAQAIAESVTLGAATSTAAGKAGSALGSALNRSSAGLAGRIQQPAVQHPQTGTSHSGRELLPKTQAGSTTPSVAQSGASTISIQGASNCSNQQVSTPGTNVRRSCNNSNGSAKPESQKYKSVVTLSFPK